MTDTNDDKIEKQQPALDDVPRIINGINYLIQRVNELQNHVTCLYGLTCDVPNIPDAKGHMQLHQQALLQLAKMVDKDLTQAGIQYFLAYGNLLGAARNGKFVPWDDDMDFCLMRYDFDRAVELLTKKYNRGLFRTTWGKSGGIFKILFMNKICLDLFPWDIYSKRTKGTEDVEAFRTKHRIAMDEARKWERGESEYDGYVDITNKILLENEAPDPKGDIFEGIDWQLFSERIVGFYHNFLWRYEYVFPLRQIKFCGHNFSAPNNVDAWLTARYGDWQSFAPEFSRHTRPKFTYEELDLLRAFVNGSIK